MDSEIEIMDRNKSLELLNEALNEIPKLRTLPPDKGQYQLWYAKVCNILELTFGKVSREYDNFSRAVRVDYPVYNEKEKREKYNKELDAYETALRAAIHKCELLNEDKPPYLEEQSPKAPREHKVWLWIKSHKIPSVIITLITLVAAGITIYQFFFSR
jgi:hypothetical protein